MEEKYKPGGGGKPQPYIPAGNGERSGEYSNKDKGQPKPTRRRAVRNRRGLFNPYSSKLVRTVKDIYSVSKSFDLKLTGKANSVIKVVFCGIIETERYYDKFGRVYLDIDYTDHGNPKTHPVVPHIHTWTYENGKFTHNNGEAFK